MAVTFLATFFGPHGLWNNPSGAWMPGKVIGFNWTNVLSLLRWELNTSSMPSALTHKGRGERLHAKLWAFLPAMWQRTPILNICMGISLRLPQGAYQLNGRHLLRVESIGTWLLVRRVNPRLRVVGQGCLTIPLLIPNAPFWRPRQWPRTRTGLTQHMKLSVSWQRGCITLTSRGTPGVSPARIAWCPVA